MSTISIIGSGGMAAAIASVATQAGHTVEIMSRDVAKAHVLAQSIGTGAHAGTFGAAPLGDIVILAVPYSAVLDAVKRYGDALAGKILIDITNPVGADLKSLVSLEDCFGAGEIVKVAPTSAHIVKAFNTQFSHILASGSLNGHPLDVFVAADNAQAKTQVVALIESLQMRPMDIGPLTMARTLEHVCLLSLALMTHSIKHTNFTIRIA